MPGLDPYYHRRFEPVRDITWERVYGGDTDAIERAIAFGQSAPPMYEPPGLEICDLEAPGPHGTVPVRVYARRDRIAPVAGLIWMHGGAFKWGDLDMLEAHAVAAELADRAGLVVVSVDYRLVPAVRYPVPLDDCFAVARWLADEGSDLGVDASRLAIGGASAGANLATATALRARDEGGPGIRAACLAYPALHREVPPATPELAALVEELPPLARFTPAIRQEIYRDYLGPAYDDPPPYGVPAVADLTGLPPFAIANAEYDDLRPSGEAFAELLRAHGVTVDDWCEAGTAHGYLNEFGMVAGASRTLDRFSQHLERHLTTGP